MTTSSDDLNPNFIFSTAATEMLLKIANGEIDANAYAAKQLANRGLDGAGEWIGFDRAAEEWAALTDACAE